MSSRLAVCESKVQHHQDPELQVGGRELGVGGGSGKAGRAPSDGALEGSASKEGCRGGWVPVRCRAGWGTSSRRRERGSAAAW